ncbi:MAG: SulP family inorganic anion transporter [Pirellulaceae bacterium]
MLNVLVAVSTLVLVFMVPKLVKRYAQKWRLLFPGTIVAIVVMTAVVHGAGWGDVIETIKLKGGLASFGDLKTLVQAQFPSQWSWKLVWIGLPFAASLAMLAYLDSLLTALVVDKKLQEKVGGSERTNQNRELAAQGIANAAVSLFGGIPGSQATIRSVLIINENATLRLASVSVGLFVVVEMVLFQGYLTLIPSAVFTGILFKVGYDVIDWPPLLTYLRGRSGAGSAERTSQEERRGLQVTLIDILFIGGTTAITVFGNLNIAVVSFTVLFYLLRLLMRVPDLQVAGEEAGGGDTPQESTES